MTTSTKSSKTAKPSTKPKKSCVTRSYSTSAEVDEELSQFCDRLKRSRSSIITEALQNFFLNHAPKDI